MRKQQQKIALLLILMITPCLSSAQKKELEQARSIIKSGKDVHKAEQLMTDLLKDKKNKDDKRIYVMWLDAVRTQYVQANNKFYLKQKQDTTAFFDLTKRMFVVAEKLDSIDARPNKKGKVDPEYRKKNATMLDQYRQNIYGGGTYFIRKADYKKAFDFLEMYIDCAKQPLFEGQDYASTDSKLPEAGYWATYCGYRMHDAVLTLRHRHLALADSAKAEHTLQFMAEARKWLKDDSLYMRTLEAGFHRFPTSAYFYPRLIDLYNAEGMIEKSLQITDSALAACDTCEMYLFAKSTILLRLERNEESAQVSEVLIKQNPQSSEAYFNAGSAYANMATTLDERKEKKQRTALFQKACAHMEQYRRMEPSEKQKWGPALYRIYLNLNMGRKFDEIDRLLKK